MSILAEEGPGVQGPGVQGPGEAAGCSGFLSLTAQERSAAGLARETFPRQVGKGEPGGAGAQRWERQCLEGQAAGGAGAGPEEGGRRAGTLRCSRNVCAPDEHNHRARSRRGERTGGVSF